MLQARDYAGRGAEIIQGRTTYSLSPRTEAGLQHYAIYPIDEYFAATTRRGTFGLCRFPEPYMFTSVSVTIRSKRRFLLKKA
jgi:hypothetical protein